MMHPPKALRRVICAPALALATVAFPAVAQGRYFPAAGDWQKRTPVQVGLTAKGVDSAVAIALRSEASAPRDQLEMQRGSFGREPHGEGIGPFKERGGPAGLIIRHGYIVAEWGDPDRVDLTHSVTKSFVSTTVGLAWDRKLIRDVHDLVRPYMTPIVALKGPPGGSPALVPVPPNVMGVNTNDGAAPPPPRGIAFDAFEVLEPFESDHNRKITWDHLLRQTSEWQGTLWGKPDWGDRPRGDIEQWKNRERPEPGAVFTYNDVRVNLLSLASLTVWRRPLPQVLREYVMDPIGASNTWRWYGYDNSWIVLDGQLVQSVSGGGHWGGGMWISARDMARFGYLTLNRGRWRAKQILSEQWIAMATTPGVNTAYGFCNYYLNTGRRALPSAPEQAFYHLGNGNNIVYVDAVNDLVIVARWINSTRSLDSMVKAILDGAH
jgi:CubicO group peptidase (beta-lactamase class C family)